MVPILFNACKKEKKSISQRHLLQARQYLVFVQDESLLEFPKNNTSKRRTVPPKADFPKTIFAGSILLLRILLRLLSNAQNNVADIIIKLPMFTSKIDSDISKFVVMMNNPKTIRDMAKYPYVLIFSPKIIKASITENMIFCI